MKYILRDLLAIKSLFSLFFPSIIVFFRSVLKISFPKNQIKVGYEISFEEKTEVFSATFRVILSQSGMYHGQMSSSCLANRDLPEEEWVKNGNGKSPIHGQNIFRYMKS